jgi:hypothetical protein
MNQDFDLAMLKSARQVTISNGNTMPLRLSNDFCNNHFIHSECLGLNAHKHHDHPKNAYCNCDLGSLAKRKDPTKNRETKDKDRANRNKLNAKRNREANTSASPF